MGIDFKMYLGLIVLACGLAIWNRRNFSEYAKYLIGLLLLTLMVEVSKYYLPQIRDEIGKLYYFGEMLLLGFTYYTVIKKTETKKKVKAIVLTLASLNLFLLYKNTESVFLIMTAINHVFFLVLGIIYVFETYIPPFAEGKLIRNPFFWINTANLFYFSGLFLQVGFDKYIKSFSVELSNQLHLINASINYIYYSLFSIGFLCKRIFK